MVDVRVDIHVLWYSFDLYERTGFSIDGRRVDGRCKVEGKEKHQNLFGGFWRFLIIMGISQSLPNAVMYMTAVWLNSVMSNGANQSANLYVYAGTTLIPPGRVFQFSRCRIVYKDFALV